MNHLYCIGQRVSDLNQLNCTVKECTVDDERPSYFVEYDDGHVVKVSETFIWSSAKHKILDIQERIVNWEQSNFNDFVIDLLHSNDPELVNKIHEMIIQRWSIRFMR
jgi:hypothetical protein